MRAHPVVLCACLIGCSRPVEPAATAPAPTTMESPVTQQAADDAPRVQRLTGTLRGGILAIGAETTGWALEIEGGKRIDTDVSKVPDDAAKLQGERVTVEGTLATVNWPERGPRQLLRARRIEPASK